MRPWTVFAASSLALVACGTNKKKPTPDAPVACTTGTNSGMGVLQDFCEPGDPGPNAFLLSASGEVLAIVGYRFPPVNPGDFALVDGWDITYSHVISTFDKVTLSDNPDEQCPGDQSMCGNPVAQVSGPWAIDLHKGGSLVGKEGPPEQAAPIAEIVDQNLHNHDAFDPSKRYAFSFDIVAATAMAQNVNLDPADLTLYQDMIAKGCTTRLIGQAVWKGNLANPACTITMIPGQAVCGTGHPACPSGTTCSGAVGSQTCQPDFSQFPTTINFDFCLAAPTSYVNAQNPENDPAAPCGTEEHQRGVHTVTNQPTIIQATFHIDHVLWESFVHDSPPHFDSFASRYAGGGATATATLDDYRGFAFAPFIDHQGNPVPWRDCVGTNYSPPGSSPNQMSFDTNGVPINPSGSCTAQSCPAIRDFDDYTLYNHSTFGHLNADGLAFVQRHYPSP